MRVVGTAGHVDHGKSTLVRALTGIDPDRFEEEKRRGLTIDLGFAWCTLPSGREIGIVDVPGHERFIRNMLAGAGAIELALFVVAADEGWKPQSEEHLQILEQLAIAGGIVALTKSDLLDADALETTREMVWQRLRGTCLHSAEIIAVSATTGSGLDDLTRALDEIVSSVGDAIDEQRPRLFVDRSFTIAGAGTVVTGTLAGGTLRVGDEVEVQPSGDRARIRSLQTHQRSLDKATPGSRVAINLVGLQRSDVERGDAIVQPERWRPTDRFAVTLTPLSTLDHMFTERGAYHLYVGSAEAACRVRFLENRSDAITAVNVDGNLRSAVKPGYSVLAEVFTDRALPLTVGDRFVLRDAGRAETVAGGSVLDVSAGPVRRGDEQELRRLREREGLRGFELARRITAERGIIPADELEVLTGVTMLGPFAYDFDYVSKIGMKAHKIVRTYHEARPLDPGITREALRQELGISTDALNFLIGGWSYLVVDGNTVRLKERPIELPAEDRARADEFLSRMREAGSSPPSLKELGMPIALAKALERADELVMVTSDIAYPSDIWVEIRERVRSHITQHGPATASALRDAIGTSRKYAIPVLERLDADRVTRRKGDLRELV